MHSILIVTKVEQSIRYNEIYIKMIPMFYKSESQPNAMTITLSKPV